MLVIQTQWKTVAVGLQDRIVAREVRPTDERKAAMLQRLGEWLAGDVEPAKVIIQGHADVAKRLTMHRKSTRDPKSRKMKHDVREVPITLGHVAAIKHYPSRPDSIDEDEPEFLRVVLDDGTKLDLPWGDVAKKDAA